MKAAKTFRSGSFSLILTVGMLSTAFQVKADKPHWPGIWGIWGGEQISNQSRPWYKGVVVTVRWSEIEPQENQFDFSILDSRINQAIDNGLLVAFKVYHGDESPDWLYDNGVPRVKTARWSRVFPYYLEIRKTCGGRTALEKKAQSLIRKKKQIKRVPGGE